MSQLKLHSVLNNNSNNRTISQCDKWITEFVHPFNMAGTPAYLAPEIAIVALGHLSSDNNKPLVSEIQDFSMEHPELIKVTSNSKHETPPVSPPRTPSSPQALAQADAWSFGVLLFEMVVGFNPFSKSTLQSTLETICDDTFNPRPSKGRLSEDLEDLIKGLLRKDSSRRLSVEMALMHRWFHPSKEASSISPILSIKIPATHHEHPRLLSVDCQMPPYDAQTLPPQTKTMKEIQNFSMSPLKQFIHSKSAFVGKPQQSLTNPPTATEIFFDSSILLPWCLHNSSASSSVFKLTPSICNNQLLYSTSSNGDYTADKVDNFQNEIIPNATFDLSHNFIRDTGD